MKSKSNFLTGQWAMVIDQASICSWFYYVPSEIVHLRKNDTYKY